MIGASWPLITFRTWRSAEYNYDIHLSLGRWSTRRGVIALFSLVALGQSIID
jgi:hypothetical protein